jgi:hypothetical protein
VESAENFSTGAKASIVGKGTGYKPGNFPRSQAMTSRQGTDHESTKPLVGRPGVRGMFRTHREGIAYKPLSVKSGWAGESGAWGRVTDDEPDRKPGPERGPPG